MILDRITPTTTPSNPLFGGDRRCGEINPGGAEGAGEWQKKKTRWGGKRERQGGNERALSQGIHSIDRLFPPINYPQKLF